MRSMLARIHEAKSIMAMKDLKHSFPLQNKQLYKQSKTMETSAEEPPGSDNKTRGNPEGWLMKSKGICFKERKNLHLIMSTIGFLLKPPFFHSSSYTHKHQSI